MLSKFDWFYNSLRERGLRVTEPRKNIVNVLQGRHLTFQEIREELSKKGHVNLASLYNNIDFLLREEAIVEIHIGNKVYYDLAIEESSHDAKSYIHTKCTNSDAIVEITDSTVIDLLRTHPRFKGFEIEKININIVGRCVHEDSQVCQMGQTLCFLYEQEKNETN